MGSFLILLPFLAISATASSPPEPPGANVIAGLSNKLAADIHKKLSAGDENVFFSPVSITIALAMLFYGTRGKSAEEMRRALGYQYTRLTDQEIHSAFQDFMEKFGEDSAVKEYLFYVANTVLAQVGYPIRDEYRTGLQTIYKATTRNVDFEKEPRKVVQEINDWVKRKTNNRITKFFDTIDPATVLILLNAVYFKGIWKTKFEHTMEGIFFNKGLETERVNVPMMYYERDVPYVQIKGGQAIELPYKGEDISMIIVLPDAMDGLSSFEKNLTPNMLRDIRRSTRKTSVIVTLPKFKLEYKKSLNTVLQELGIKNVFERSANLSGISRAGPLVVSEILHKAVVQVNEEGSEASAVTGVVMVPVSAKLSRRFVANHPFLFAIYDNRYDLVLFQGRVSKL